METNRHTVAEQRSPVVMIVDDDDLIRAAFVEVMRLDQYESLEARSGEEALILLEGQQPDVMFLDISMPRLDGLEVLRSIKNLYPALPVIIITGFGTTQTAIKAIQLGAYEYITKPLDGKVVRDIVQRVLSNSHSESLLKLREKKEKSEREKNGEDTFVGNSSAMQEVYKLIGSISLTPNETSILILGESGTGKELAARVIHTNSVHAMEPFVAINCTALPENLLESELFGHEKGAFTGAIERKKGKFEFAAGGTIFLDEIGDVPKELQKKLLRVIQERQYERIGSNSMLPVRARFIAATNRDLAHEVEIGNFREDLFYRINVVTVTLPPLRHRKEDIRLLAEYFLEKYNRRLNKHVEGFSEEAIASLLSYGFPGNVRELGNMIERAVMMAKSTVIVPDLLHHPLQKQLRKENTVPNSMIFSEARESVLNSFEQQFIEYVLHESQGNVTAAARLSKMTRQNFQRLMTKHQISADRFRHH